ncbi:nad(p)h-quinone oxidoreductase subunit 5, partial [Quercus suber]
VLGLINPFISFDYSCLFKSIVVFRSGSIIHSMDAVVKTWSLWGFNKTCTDHKNCFFISILSLEVFHPLLIFGPKMKFLIIFGYLNVNFQNYNGKTITHFIQCLYGIKMSQPFITLTHFGITNTFSYPHESDSTMLFPMFVLGIFTFFVGSMGIPFNQFNQQRVDLDILSKLLTPNINLFIKIQTIRWIVMNL